MKEYILDFNEIEKAMKMPDENILAEIILENNNDFKFMYNDWNLIVECENKPRDSAVYGIKWIERKEMIN